MLESGIIILIYCKFRTDYMLKGRTLTFILLGMIGLMFIAICVSIYFSSAFSTGEKSKAVTIDGYYSVDGGEWKPTVRDKMVNENFKELKIKGKLSQEVFGNDILIISAQNLWYKLSANKFEILNNSTSGKNLKTPGYTINYSEPNYIRPGAELELTVTNPYSKLSAKTLSSLMKIYIGDQGTPYSLFLNTHGFTAVVCILLCFFGLIAFPIAGFVMGGIDYRYLSFGIMCFFAGLFIFFDSTRSFLPLWIKNRQLCMAIDIITNYFFMISLVVYIKTNLEKTAHKITANIVLLLTAVAFVTISVLHFFDIADYYATQPYMYVLFGVLIIVDAICLVREAVYKSVEANSVLMSFIPVGICLFIDVSNAFLGFMQNNILVFGVIIALVIQLVQLVIDMRAQYKEMIRYQQMQSELYEAKVSLMVSQIQPHFLYNSLTSIAMMCTKDPKLAKTATINFADYLRGNMNSLKEKKPVPFNRELEHLKKYLMLEQMRFGDMLNIEYDIQCTDFSLPQLSVQPLVENAVKHGVGMKEDGGTVTIATRETDDAYEVIISDDGVGFDTSDPPKDDGRSHVGMENVKHRLKDMCNADVIIESEIGKGTVSTIRIPKEDTK